MLPKLGLQRDFEFFAYKLRPPFAPFVLGRMGTGVGPRDPSPPPAPREAGPGQRRRAETLPMPSWLLTQHAFGTEGCFGTTSWRKICLNDSLERFMTHINCKVCVSTLSSQLHLLHEYSSAVLLFIPSKYLNGHTLHNFPPDTLNFTPTHRASLWRIQVTSYHKYSNYPSEVNRR